MSIRVDSSSLITGAVVVGVPGLGVLAELVPSTGEHGPGIASTWLGPAEAGKEVRVLITQWPEVGSLFVWEDTSFEYNGPGGAAYAQLFVDGLPVDTPQTVTFTVGAASSVSSALSGTYTIRGAVSSDLPGTFTVRSTVSSDLSGGYEVLSANTVSSDLSGAYAVRGSVSADLSGSYQVGDGHSISPSQAALLYNLYRLHGLAEPLTVSPSSREVASLQQQVTSLGEATTIETISLPVEVPLNPGLLIEELAALHGLTAPLIVTSEGRTAGAIVQSFSSAGNLTVITRQ